MKTLLPIATLVLGYLGSLLTEWFRDSRQSKRQQVEAGAASTLRRTEFQRQTLLELQPLMPELVFEYGNSFNAALRDSAQNRWNSVEFNEVMRDLIARVMLLGSRVLDNELRETLVQLRHCCTEITSAKSESDARRSLHRARELQSAGVECTGALIRAFDTEP